MSHKFDTKKMDTRVKGIDKRIDETVAAVSQHTDVRDRLREAMDHLESDVRASGLNDAQTKLLDTFRNNRESWIQMVLGD